MGSSQEAITVGRWTGDFIVPTCVISQPRFFPGLHYLHRMMVTDVFVVLDTVQFTPRHEENRAKLKGPQGPQWLTVPVRQSRRDQLIGEIRPDDTQPWPRKLIGDRKSTRLNSSHSQISYAVFCLKKKNHTATCVTAAVSMD